MSTTLASSNQPRASRMRERMAALDGAHLHPVPVACLAPSSPLRRKYDSATTLFVTLFDSRTKGAVFLEGLCVSIQEAADGGAWGRIEYVEREE